MLVDEVISILSTEDGSITNALLKTKIILHEIGKKELVEWIRKETNGYNSYDDIPPYRILAGRLMGDISTGFVRYSAYQLPIMHLSKPEQERFTQNEIREPLSAVQSLAKAGALMRPLPPEYASRLAKGLEEGFYIEKAWVQLRAEDVANIVFQVRTRLLDFMLELRDQVGRETMDKELKDKTENIDTTSMFNRAIFGDNATVIVGSHNRVSINDNVELTAELTKLFKAAGGEVTDQITADLKKLAELAEAKNVDEAKSLLQRIFNFAGDGVKNTAWGVVASYIAKLLGIS